MVRGRNFWAKLDTVVVSGGSSDWNIADEINQSAVVLEASLIDIIFN
jgi:hypothetical protein